jgi:hypothetical protein
MKTEIRITQVITTLLLFIVYLTGYAQPINAIIKHGNVWLIDSNGIDQQLTSTGKDTMPVISLDRKCVTFIRQTNGPKNATSNFDSSQIWLVDLKSNTTTLVVQSKPDSANTLSLLRGGFDALQFSPDSKYLYFLSIAWPLSMAVHRIDLSTKQDQFVSDGNSLYVIPKGAHAGYLIVLKHKNSPGGSTYDHNWLLKPDGIEVRDMGLYKKQMKIK